MFATSNAAEFIINDIHLSTRYKGQRKFYYKISELYANRYHNG